MDCMKDPAFMDHLAALSHLSFEGEARDRMAADMESIMKLMDTITEATFSEEEIFAAEGEMELLREDEVQPSMPAGELLANAKQKVDSFIAVQKLMD
jgi:aspartyl/glutamyl-tRNA(Asn/Gln) amidotransferase C subunit